jgi:hypothetical protein
VLASVTFAISEKDPALRVMKSVADCYSLHRYLRLDFFNGKPKKAVEHLVSVIRPVTPKTLIESRLWMDKSDLKKDFLEIIAYLEKMALIHDRHCHVLENMKTGDSGMNKLAKAETLTAVVLGTSLEEGRMVVAEIWRLTVTERSPDMIGRQTRLALE